VCGIPFFPRVLVQLVGLSVVVGQRLAVGGVQGAGLDRMPQPEQMLAADPDLAGELGSGLSLGQATEDQEDLRRAQVGPLPGGVGVHIEDAAAAFTAVIDDRGIGTAAVDVEALAGATTRASEPLGVEQIEEPLAATLLVHQVDDREVHGVGSGKID
jgi:hypothetical protein